MTRDRNDDAVERVDRVVRAFTVKNEIEALTLCASAAMRFTLSLGLLTMTCLLRTRRKCQYRTRQIGAGVGPGLVSAGVSTPLVALQGHGRASRACRARPVRQGGTVEQVEQLEVAALGRPRLGRARWTVADNRPGRRSRPSRGITCGAKRCRPVVLVGTLEEVRVGIVAGRGSRPN